METLYHGKNYHNGLIKTFVFNQVLHFENIPYLGVCWNVRERHSRLTKAPKNASRGIFKYSRIRLTYYFMYLVF